MKTLYKILFICTLIIQIQSCDKIVAPYKETGGIDTGTATKKVLLEDYTGHTCVNCPAAGKKAIELQDLYEGKLIVMSVHAGYFAEPAGIPFNDDFRSVAGTEWDDFFGISTAGNPNGMINRQNTGGDYIVSDAEWSTKIAEIINEDAVATININTSYNPASRKLDIELKSKILSSLEGNYKVQVCLVEDSLIGAQKNNDPNIGPSVIMDYVHRHVLREAINTSWGTDLVDGGGQAIANTEYTHTFTQTLNIAYDDTHCMIIAWIYNADNKGIIQVEEKKIQ